MILRELTIRSSYFYTKNALFFIFLLVLQISEAIHPLQPIGKEEIQNAVKLIHEICDNSTRIIYIDLKEPDKILFYNWSTNPDQPPPDREATAILFNPDTNRALTVTIDLTHNLITNVTIEPVGTQPMITADETYHLGQAVKSSAAVKEVLETLYEITNTSDVVLGLLTYGYYGSEDNSTRRLARTLFFLWDDPTKSVYAKPLTGFQAIVDLGSMEVL